MVVVKVDASLFWDDSINITILFVWASLHCYFDLRLGSPCMTVTMHTGMAPLCMENHGYKIGATCGIYLEG
jgi:hypothetical protein